MSYGLASRTLSAPIGVNQQHRFGQTRAYVPLSQFFLQQGGKSPEGNEKGVLTGKQAKGEKKPKTKKTKKTKKPKADTEAMVEVEDEKGNRFALLFDETKKHPEFGGWKLLGINDEVETCENCGKRGLKRTMVLEPVDGDGGIIYVGTTCGEILTGRQGSWLMKRATQVQQEKEKVTASSGRSELIGKLVGSKFWKLHRNMWGRYFHGTVKGGHPLDGRDKRSLRRMMANLLRDTGLSSDVIKAHFKGGLDSTTQHHVDDWYAIALGKTEMTGTVFKSGAAGPSAGMTGSGNIPAVAVPIGAGDGGWDAIDAPGRKRKRKRKKGDDELSKGISYLLRPAW